MSVSEEECRICGRGPGEWIAFCRSFAETPFVDGRTYDLICYYCLCARKGFAELYTVAEMMEDGFTKAEAERSINLIKKLLKKPGLIVQQDGPVILDQIYMPDEPLPLTS